MTWRRVLLTVGLTVSLGASGAACHHGGLPPASATWGTVPTGPAGAAGPAVAGGNGSAKAIDGPIRSAPWDILVDNVTPGAVTVDEAADHYQVSNMGKDDAGNTKGSLEEGLFGLLISRDAAAGNDAEAYAELGRQAWIDKGYTVTPTDDTELMGLDARFFLFTQGETTGAEFHAVQGACEYFLIVMRAGPAEDIVDYVKSLLANFRTVSGGPPNAPRCQ